MQFKMYPKETNIIIIIIYVDIITWEHFQLTKIRLPIFLI